MGSKERQAHRALLDLLKLADVSDDPSDVQLVADTIRRKEFSPYTVKKINKALIDFIKKYARTETARRNGPIIHALFTTNRFLPPEERPFKPRWHRQ